MTIHFWGRHWLASTAFFILSIAAVETQGREWTDITGKHKLEAEFVKIEHGKVILRNPEGKESRVPLTKLSKEDQSFLRKLRKSSTPSGNIKEDEKNDSEAIKIVETATQFFTGLRSDNLGKTFETLSAAARKLAKKNTPIFKQFPKPNQGDKNIIYGDAQIQNKLAGIPMRIRSGQEWYQSVVYLRLENTQWKVFALAALTADGEKKFNFEKDGASVAPVDPLQALIGQKIQLSGYAIEGQPINLSQYQGKVVLVEFWATWCGACRGEIPNIRANYEQYNAQGFEVLAVSVDKNLNTLQTFVEENQLPWTVVADYHPQNKSKMGAKFGIRGIPAFILVGRDGRVASVNCRGKRLGLELQRLIASGG